MVEEKKTSVGLKPPASAEFKFDISTSSHFDSSSKSSPENHPLSFSAFPALRRPILDELDEDLVLTDDQSEIFNEKDFMRLSKQLPKRLVIIFSL